MTELILGLVLAEFFDDHKRILHFGDALFVCNLMECKRFGDTRSIDMFIVDKRTQTYKVRYHGLYAPDNDQEEEEFNNLCEL